MKNVEPLDAIEFSQKRKEPLWSMPDAILYSCGLQIIEGADEDKIETINNDKTAKSLLKYLCDAVDLGKLKLEQDFLDKPFGKYCDQKNKIFDARVEPALFIEVVKKLPLDLPLTKQGNTETQKPLSDKERKSLLKIILGMALTNYEFDPKAERSSIVSEITSDLELHGISLDKDTVRKWLKEAISLLPQDWNKSA